MEIRLEFPPGTKVETVTTPEDGIVLLKITPFFATTRGTALIANAKVVTGAGKHVDQAALAVSGTSGQILVRKRNQSVKPLIDMTKEELAARDKK